MTFYSTLKWLLSSKGAKFIYKVMLGMMILLITLILVIRIPQVQVYLAAKITSYVHQKTGFSTEINHIYISWFDEIDINGLIIHDLDNDLMVSLGEIKADLDLVALVSEQVILFNGLSIDKGEINLSKQSGKEEINLVSFIRSLSQTNSSTNSKKSTVKLDIGGVNLEEMNFSYHDYNIPKNDARIDFSHFRVNNIFTQIDQILVDSTLITIDVVNFKANLDSLIIVKNLRSNIEFDQEGLHFSQFDLKTLNSATNGNFDFKYKSLSDLGRFVEKVAVDAKIENGLIDTKELGYFVNLPKQLDNTQIEIAGHLFGKINSMQGDNVSLSIDQLIDFKANMFVIGLPNVSETFMDLDFQNANVNLQSLFSKFGNDSIRFPNSINRLNYKGEFTGFLSDFVTKGSFNTKAGNLYTDVNLKIRNYPITTVYEGYVSTERFDLGSIIGDTSLLQDIALTGSLNGTGLTVESADLFLKSTVDKIGVNGYEYTNIITDGEFKSQFFNGKLLVNDPNLQLAVDGRIDMSNQKEEIAAFIDVDSVNLKNIKLTSEDIVISGQSNLEIEGFGVDKVTGIGTLKNFLMKKNGQTLFLDSITLEIRQVNENKIIDLFSDGIEAQLSGDFKLSQVGADIINLGDELLLELGNDSLKLSDYYLNKLEIAESDAYAVQFFANVQNPNKLIRPFFSDIFLSNDLSVFGDLYHGVNTDLSISLDLDSVSYSGNAMTNNYVSVNLSKLSEKSRVTGQAEIFSERQYLGEALESNSFEANASWSRNEIGFDIAAIRDSLNSIDISGLLNFVNDSTSLVFDSSSVKLDNHVFHFNKDNRVLIPSNALLDSILIENLVLTDGLQFLSLDGLLGEMTDLDITVGNLDMINLNALSKREIKGVANGFVNFRKASTGSYFAGELKVDEFYVDDFLVGDIKANTSWDEFEKKIQVDFNIFRQGVNAIKVLGDVSVNSKERILDLRADFDGAQLALLAPYLEGVASNLAGEVTGELGITGTLDYPVINGDAMLENGGILIDYLQTDYKYAGNLAFSQDKISFDRLEITDFKGNKAFASGSINHDGFKNVLIDAEADLFNFNVLNTNQKDNQLFYGEAYATGQGSLYGTPKNIKISANVETNKSTKIFVPLSEDTGTDIKEYISFVDYSDTLNLNEVIEETSDLRGVELDFTIDVTPDAYFELIFDIKSGDIIRGRGDGDIKLSVNTEGDFSMFGDYEIKEGGYNFTLYNIINKEFVINPGSKISWYGDPYKALLDIEAKYSQVVSLAPIINDDESNVRANSIVKLFLDGEMLEPEINFDIDFEEYPLAEAVFVDAFKTSIKADKQLLNRQVFSLLILKRLFDVNDGFVAGQAIGVSVSEFVSNQLSYWINQVDDNLEIDVDISSLDADAFNAFRLRLSYKFLDGRLRITRGGGFGTVTTNGQTDPNKLGNIIGDITLEYLLTPDGRLRVKMFTRNNQNGFEDDYAFETGASIRYVRSFDYLKEIWLKAQTKKVKFVDANGNEVNKTPN